MPCYAVATAKALVSNQAFSKYLTKDLLRQIITLVAQETGIEIQKRDYDHNQWVSDIWLQGDRGMLGVGYLADGSVTIAISTDSTKAQAFQDALKTKIGTVAAALLNQDIAKILQAQGAQEVSTTFKPNGVAVTTFSS